MILTQLIIAGSDGRHSRVSEWCWSKITYGVCYVHTLECTSLKALGTAGMANRNRKFSYFLIAGISFARVPIECEGQNSSGWSYGTPGRKEADLWLRGNKTLPLCHVPNVMHVNCLITIRKAECNINITGIWHVNQNKWNYPPKKRIECG